MKKEKKFEIVATEDDYPSFESELTNLINKYSKENGSDTPDFILTQYLSGCLEAFNATLKAREKWYGREVKDNTTQTIMEEN